MDSTLKLSNLKKYRAEICLVVVLIGLMFEMFSVGEQVKMQREVNATLTKELQAAREALNIWRAEWMYVSSPANLEAVARRHLKATETSFIRTKPRDKERALALHVKIQSSKLPPSTDNTFGTNE